MSLFVEGIHVPSVSFSRNPVTLLSSRLFGSLQQPSGSPVLITTAVPGYPSSSVPLVIAVSNSASHDVVLGLDWASSLRESLLFLDIRVGHTFDAWDFFSLDDHPLFLLFAQPVTALRQSVFNQEFERLFTLARDRPPWSLPVHPRLHSESLLGVKPHPLPVIAGPLPGNTLPVFGPSLASADGGSAGALPSWSNLNIPLWSSAPSWFSDVTVPVASCSNRPPVTGADILMCPMPSGSRLPDLQAAEARCPQHKGCITSIGADIDIGGRRCTVITLHMPPEATGSTRDMYSAQVDLLGQIADVDRSYCVRQLVPRVACDSFARQDASSKVYWGSEALFYTVPTPVVSEESIGKKVRGPEGEMSV
ncbi:hypothetical protein C8R43DRAFT_950487 [Mycena crocata]|nr:hypothetical protein C8R43DRAFT_950487 [Mycena crocata]